jgi:hypothetical protein
VWSAVEGLLGRDVSHRSARAMADEVIEVCQRKLELVGRDRGWPACPRVMNLDE